MLDLTPVLICLIVFGFVLAVVRTGANHRYRMSWLEKGPNAVPPKPLDLGTEDAAGSSLKWGLVCLLVGLAMLIIELMPRTFDNRGEAALGAMFLAAGLGLLLYYFIADARKKRAQ